MKKTLFILLFSVSRLYAQEAAMPSITHDTDVSDEQEAVQLHKHADHIYHIKYQTVAPIVAVSYGIVLYDFSKIYKKSQTPEATILALNKNNVPVFDRWATKYHDVNMDKISYYPFYAVMPLPAILFIDKKMRKDAARISMIYLEAFAFTGLIYGNSVYFVDRFRPDVYNTSLPMSYRSEGNYRNSFFAGHVAVMATATFFIARVYDDYHPESNWKWALYGGATAATLGMGYMRLEAGKHFPSDILLGAAVGTASGLLTPLIHKNKNSTTQKWTVVPSLMEQGPAMSFTYKL